MYSILSIHFVEELSQEPLAKQKGIHLHVKSFS